MEVGSEECQKWCMLFGWPLISQHIVFPHTLKKIYCDALNGEPYIISFNCQIFCYIKYRWRQRAFGPFVIKWRHLI